MPSDHWLVSYSRELYERTVNDNPVMVHDPDANALMCDLEHFPHAFVLACCMDKQVVAERAWRIPYVIRNQLCNDFTIESLSKIPSEEYIATFERFHLHRFNRDMAKVFYNAVHHIDNQYGGDASRIWSGYPSSAVVVLRFLQFDGVGSKIATMAANLLVRDLHVQFSDFYSIDVSVDVHVRRVLHRMGLVSLDPTNDEIVYTARALCPEYPGIIDKACWRIGRNYCRPQNPDCAHCPVGASCPRILAEAAKE